MTNSEVRNGSYVELPREVQAHRREQCEMWPNDGPSAQLEAMFPDEWTPEQKAKFAAHCERRASGMKP